MLEEISFGLQNFRMISKYREGKQIQEELLAL